MAVSFNVQGDFETVRRHKNKGKDLGDSNVSSKGPGNAYSGRESLRWPCMQHAVTWAGRYGSRCTTGSELVEIEGWVGLRGREGEAGMVEDA